MDASEGRELLAERPDLEEPLATVLAVDRDHDDGWTFQDVPVDSGAFGELVAAGLVEDAGDGDDGYRVADPDAVAAALAGEPSGVGDTRQTRAVPSLGAVGLPSVDRVAAGTLAVALLLVVAVRASTYPAVHRDRVLFLGNDPFYYAYLVRGALADGWAPGALPGGAATKDPLTMLQLLVAVEALGGLAGDPLVVLAWLPVAAAVATAGLLYLLACELTGDRRVGLAAVVCLAVVPVHTVRTALGFADHHAFDYLWLVVTAWGLVAAFGLDALERDWRTVRAVGLVALGVAGQVLAWWAGALLIVPVGVAVVAAGLVAVHTDTSFRTPGLATLAGVTIAAVVVLAAHLAFGWHEGLVVVAPWALAGGIAVVVAATAGWRRLALPAWTFPASGLAALAVAGVGLRVAAPALWADAFDRLVGLFAEREIVEMQSLFGSDTMGWLMLFGFLLVAALPPLLWASYRGGRGDRRWLAPAAYAWTLLVLAGVQSRFAGELAPFVALFTGVAVVHLAASVDAARPLAPLADDHDPALSLPDGGAAFRIAAILLLVCGLSAVQAPILATNMAIPDEQYETATAIEADAAAHGYDYPESYVFSPWSWSRMYNYVVSGEAAGYGHAQANYRAFVAETDPAAAHDRLRGGTGYVVTEPWAADAPPEAMQRRLHDRYGSRGDDVAGLGHYRAIHASSGGDYKAFRVVPGATITGEAAPGEAVVVATVVELEHASFTYERATTADEDGRYSVTVANPGEYAVEGATTESVTVPEAAVLDGDDVDAS